MSKYIDADLYVEMQIYDDEHEDWLWWKGSIEELLDQWTEEGCPTPIEVSEDCISREYVEEQLQQIEDITAMAHIDLGEDPYDETGEITMPISTVRKIFKDAPSVVPSCQKNRQVERAEGEWELASDNDGEYGICSLCGNDADFTHYGKPYHYCPNCGAKMKKQVKTFT